LSQRSTLEIAPRTCLSDRASHISTETRSDIPKSKVTLDQICNSKKPWVYLEGSKVGGFKAVLVTIDGADG